MARGAQQQSANARRRPVGLKEVAERANVAISSVSRVLTDHPDVSEEMRARVLAAAEELGYEPDLLAQSLRRGQTLSVGFVVRDISNPILAEIAHAAETGLSEGGYSTMLTNSGGEPANDAAGIRLFRRRRVDGLLLSLADEGYEATLDEIEQVQVPIVLIDRELKRDLPVSAVFADHEQGTRQAVARMIELGHRHIGLLSGRRGIFSIRATEAAFRSECERAGVEALIEPGSLRPEDGYRAAMRLLERDPRPTALLTASNQILVGALHALRELGLRIPADISLVTFDEIPLLDLFTPPIAVISRQPRELGRRAAEELLRRMRNEGEPSKIMIPTVFEPRESLGPAPRA